MLTCTVRPENGKYRYFSIGKKLVFRITFVLFNVLSSGFWRFVRENFFCRKFFCQKFFLSKIFFCRKFFCRTFFLSKIFDMCFEKFCVCVDLVYSYFKKLRFNHPPTSAVDFFHLLNICRDYV